MSIKDSLYTMMVGCGIFLSQFYRKRDQNRSLNCVLNLLYHVIWLLNGSMNHEKTGFMNMINSFPHRRKEGLNRIYLILPIFQFCYSSFEKYQLFQEMGESQLHLGFPQNSDIRHSRLEVFVVNCIWQRRPSRQQCRL